MSDNKKYLKIAGSVVAAGLISYGIYKVATKQKALTDPTTYPIPERNYMKVSDQDLDSQ